MRRWEHQGATVEYAATHATVPCSIALFTCRCGAKAVEYDLRRNLPDRWSRADNGSHLCPHCAAAKPK